jgi:hypothetical protein
MPPPNTLPYPSGANGGLGDLVTHDFWQTINPTRVIQKQMGQITVPQLGVISSNTLGVANLAAKLNYVAPNNFTIQLTSIPQTVPQNYNLCIRYTQPVSGQMFRFKFWNISTFPQIDVPAALYTGQPIYGAAFSIEVWSVGNQQSCALLQPLVLNTSVMKAKCTLTDVDIFDLADPSQCGSLFLLNAGPPYFPPLTVAACAAS